MHDIAPLIRDLAVMLGIAGLVMIIFQKIRQPVILGYLIAGIIVGPYTPPHTLVADLPSIKILSELGVIFLMFSLGLEFSFQKLTRIGISASITGLVEIVLMIFLGYITAKFLGWSFHDEVFLGAALAISSTTIIVKALEELNLKNQNFAQLIFGVLIIEDLVAILLLVGLSMIVVSDNVFSFTLVQAVVRLAIVIGGWFLMGYFLVPTLIRRVTGLVTQETLTIISVALCLLLVNIAAYFNYSVALGAFIMGSILAETTLIHRIEQLIRPIRDIFAAVFFISIGMLIDPKVIFHHWYEIILIAGVVIVGKIITTTLGALITGQKLDDSLRVGFAMAQIGEFSFIIAGLGIALSVTSTTFYPIIVAVSAITTFTTPYLIRLSAHIGGWLDAKLPHVVKRVVSEHSVRMEHFLGTNSKSSCTKKYVIRLLLNGIVVAILFSFVEKILLPEFGEFVRNEDFVDTLSWFIALVLSAPFIWAMLFSYEFPLLAEEEAKVKKIVIILGILFTLSELLFLSIAYFYTWTAIFCLLVLAIITIIIFSRQLKKPYQWFEHNLVRNINKAPIIPFEDFKERNLLENVSLTAVYIDANHPFIGSSLRDKELEQYLGGVIIAIERQGEKKYDLHAELKLTVADIVFLLNEKN